MHRGKIDANRLLSTDGWCTHRSVNSRIAYSRKVSLAFGALPGMLLSAKYDYVTMVYLYIFIQLQSGSSFEIVGPYLLKRKQDHVQNRFGHLPLA